jgi:hypothetical protein
MTEIANRLYDLGSRVYSLQTNVCDLLCRKYSSGLSSDDHTQGLSQQVIDQFNSLRPHFEQLEKVGDVWVFMGGEVQ